MSDRSVGMRMRGINNGKNRGFVLPYVMTFIMILMLVSSMILAQAQATGNGELALEQKNYSLNAAEAGLNAALESLDGSLLFTQDGKGTLSDGSSYSYTISGNFGSGVGKIGHDPTGPKTIPGDAGLIVSTGTGPNGERTSTAEAVVANHVVHVNFEQYAIIAGRNIQGTYQGAIDDLAKGNKALVQANGSINASVVGGLAGRAAASGDTNTLPPRTTGATSIGLPTVGQFDTMAANYENQVKLQPGPADVYLPDGATLASSYVCPAASQAAGCVLFYDGTLESASEQTTFAGGWTVVLNGEYDQTGASSMNFVGTSNIVIVNGSARITGLGIKNAYVEVKGTTTFGDTASITGALITLGSFNFDGQSSTGGFHFDGSVIPPGATIVGKVKVVTYAEY